MHPAAYLRARLIWSWGSPIPVDLAFDLAALGYDVPALEARYLG
jgi:hypothetical protein